MRRIILFFAVLILILVNTGLAQTMQNTDTFNQTDAKGQKQGAWKKTDKLGRLVYIGSFLDNRPTGHFTYYDTTGKVRVESEFTENGTKSFSTSFYHGSGKMSEGNYLNEKRDGVWKFYNEEGVLVSEETYNKGLAEGIWKTFYSNGAILEEVVYANGIKEGPWVQYYYDGPVKLNATYKNGKLEGLATFFHVNGKVMVSGPYVNNLKDGVWLHLNEKGVAEKKEVWSNGFMQVEEYYDKAVERMTKEEK